MCYRDKDNLISVFNNMLIFFVQLVTNTLAVGEEFHHHYQVTEPGLSIKTWIIYSIGLDFNRQLCFCFYCRSLLGHCGS